MQFSIRLARWAAACSLAFLAACGGGEAPPPGASALKADVSAFTGHGVYWNPAEPGSGFFFEAQGGVGIATFYMYETTGRPVWYAANGAFTPNGATGYRFEGELQRYAGGQPDSSTLSRQPTPTPMGRASIEFDGVAARVSLPGRSYQAQKFFQTGQGPTAQQPETGIYWIPAENGRGYTIEVRDNVASITVFHYTAAGDPTWHLVSLPLNGSRETQGDFTLYQGGQSLNGPHQVPRASSGGRFTATLDDACGGRIASPMAGGGLIRRFAFGSLPAGAECRTPGAKAAQAWLPDRGGQTFQYDLGWWELDPADVPGQLNSQGRLGFVPYRRLSDDGREQLFVRSSSDRFTFLQAKMVASDAAEMNRYAADAYRWLGHLDHVVNFTYFVRTGNSVRYDYLLEPRREPFFTTDQYLDLLNRHGAQGYRHVGLHDNATAEFREVFERDKNFPSARFRYEQVPMPASEAAFLAVLNERGARGFRFAGTRRWDVPAADNALLFEKDTTLASVTFSYYRRDVPTHVFDRLAQMNAEGAKGALLHSVTPIGGTAPAHLYYTMRNCSGPICEPRRLVSAFLW